MDLLSIPSDVLERMIGVVDKANAALGPPCHKAFVVHSDVGLHRAMADSVFDEGFRLTNAREMKHHEASCRVKVRERETAKHEGVFGLREDNQDFHSTLARA